jgi:hypothetical protein
LPCGSGSWKCGAGVPSGSIVDAMAVMLIPPVFSRES